MLSKLKLNQLYFKDTSFVNLMTKRIFNVLWLLIRMMLLCWKMTDESMKRYLMNT